ncbi:hypothetical protein [Hymenobacter algoricola]|uniref:Uncharacterized protein n=1 Tax=Hymenobacter algoricola TaxID=486267 RepID=A0ABP7NVR9_9BACT
MLRHSQYVGLLRTLATTHKKIQHTPVAPRFARVIISVDPMQRVVDMHELGTLLTKLKAGPGAQVLVVESCTTDYLDNGGDNRQRRRHGAFMVLQKLKSNTDYDAIEHALDATEITAEQIVGGIEQHLAGQVKVRLVPGSLAGDDIGPLGDGTWYGHRMDFDFTTPASAALAYDSSAFNPA